MRVGFRSDHSSCLREACSPVANPTRRPVSAPVPPPLPRGAPRTRPLASGPPEPRTVHAPWPLPSAAHVVEPGEARIREDHSGSAAGLGGRASATQPGRPPVRAPIFPLPEGGRRHSAGQPSPAPAAPPGGRRGDARWARGAACLGSLSPAPGPSGPSPLAPGAEP